MRVAPRTVSSKHPPRSWSMRRPKTGSESNRGQHIQSMEPDRDVRAAVLQSPSRPYSRSGDGCHRPAGGRCQLMRPILSAGASRRYSPHESRIPARVILDLPAGSTPRLPDWTSGSGRDRRLSGDEPGELPSRARTAPRATGRGCGSRARPRPADPWPYRPDRHMGHCQADIAVGRLVGLLGPEPGEVTASRIGLLVQACEATAGLIGGAHCAVYRSPAPRPAIAQRTPPPPSGPVRSTWRSPGVPCICPPLALRGLPPHPGELLQVSIGNCGRTRRGAPGARAGLGQLATIGFLNTTR